MRILIIIVIIFSICSCKHFKKDHNGKKTIVETKDGSIKAEQIELDDPYDLVVDKLLKSAYINYKNNNFNKAIINYETAQLFNTPLDFWHSYALAYCYLTIGNFDKSIQILSNLIEDKPEFADAYLLLGFNYQRKNQIDKAIDQFNKALNLETHPPSTYYYLSLAKKQKDQKAKVADLLLKAKDEYTEILDKNPNDFETLLEYSYFLASFGYLNLARMYLDKSKTILNISPEIEEKTYRESSAPYQNPIWSSFYINFVEGIILHKQGDHLQSNQHLFASLQNPPSGSKIDIAEIYLFISKNFAALNNKEAGNKALVVAKSIDPQIEKKLP